VLIVIRSADRDLLFLALLLLLRSLLLTAHRAQDTTFDTISVADPNTLVCHAPKLTCSPM